MGVSLGVVGTLFSCTAAAMVLSNIWLPTFSDKYGRRNAMLISLVGSTVGYGGQVGDVLDLVFDKYFSC